MLLILSALIFTMINNLISDFGNKSNRIFNDCLCVGVIDFYILFAFYTTLKPYFFAASAPH